MGPTTRRGTSRAVDAAGASSRRPSRGWTWTTSLQWRFFRQTVETLRGRGNRVFVVVGPFNEHMLTPESLAAYRRRQGQVEAWLTASGSRYVAPPALPSELYADASHPLAAGYEALAHKVLEAFENPKTLAQTHGSVERYGLVADPRNSL